MTPEQMAVELVKHDPLDPLTMGQVTHMKAGPLIISLSRCITAQRAEIEALRKERDEAVEWIDVVRDEMTIAGWPSGDRNVALGNLRAMIKVYLSELQAEQRVAALEAENGKLRQRLDGKVVHLYVSGIETVACGDDAAGFMATAPAQVTCEKCRSFLPPATPLTTDATTRAQEER